MQNILKINIAAMLLLTSLATTSCTQVYQDPYGFEPLSQQTELEVLKLVKTMRSSNFITRAKSSNLLRARIVSRLPGGPAVVPYIVPLLDSPQWDVRAEAIKLLIKYGRFSPSAIASLIDIMGDKGITAHLRDRIAETLRSWTENDFGYNAMNSDDSQERALAAWKKWLEDTGGVFRKESAELFKDVESQLFPPAAE